MEKTFYTLLETSSFFKLLDGAYEREFSCWPPPLTMVTFSILEAVIFVADIYSK